MDRITELVQALLGDGQRGQAELAKLVVTAAVRNFARYREQYRLCALLFVFKQRGLDDEAEQIRAEILAGLAQDDEVSMIIEICKSSQTPADVASLLRAILENPQPGVTESAAFRLAQNLESARPDIFAAISLWPYDNLRAFEDRLRDAKSVTWADDFRDTVAECAANRSDAVDLGKIVLWLLFDVPDGRGRALARDPGRERASLLLAKAVQRRLSGAAGHADLRAAQLPGKRPGSWAGPPTPGSGGGGHCVRWRPSRSPRTTTSTTWLAW